MTVEQTYRGYRESARKRRSWAAGNQGNRAIRAELLAAVLEFAEELPRGAGRTLDISHGVGKILDIGCGGGWLLERLAGRGAEQSHARGVAEGRLRGIAEDRLHGVDLLEPRVEVARRRLPGATIDLADARALPHPDAEFELVTMLTCLSSLPDRAAVAEALSEARRVLAPGGLLLVYEPRIANPFNRATVPVPLRLMREVLGPEQASRRLTGFPPPARRLGPATPRLYPILSRTVPTHRLTAWRAQ